MNAIEPALTSYYQQAFDTFPSSTVLRFDSLPTNYEKKLTQKSQLGQYTSRYDSKARLMATLTLEDQRKKKQFHAAIMQGAIFGLQDAIKELIDVNQNFLNLM